MDCNGLAEDIAGKRENRAVVSISHRMAHLKRLRAVEEQRMQRLGEHLPGDAVLYEDSGAD